MATNEQRIWQYFEKKGFSKYGIAGLMGNLRAESGLNPKNLQNTYEKSLGMTDAQYTQAVDNGTYTNFIKDSAGYGLAQWTFWSRKEKLMEFAKSNKRSIGDLDMQLDFLYKELKENYSSVFKTLCNATSVLEASNAVLLKYERPANQSVEVQKKRAAYGQEIFDKYASNKITSSTNKEETKVGKVITTGMISATINGIKVDTSKKCHSSNYVNNSSRTVNYIVMHYTGNSKDTAWANANYFQGANRNASAHFFVDNTSIYQSVELRDTAWHCGGSTYYHSSCRNSNAIGIEMCCTAGNYTISATTIKNSAYLCAYLCKQLGITANQVDTYVLRHYDVTHKKCPAQMVDNSPTQDKDWVAFKSQVKTILGAASSSTSTKPTTSTTTSKELYRVRKTWKDAESQVGAYSSLTNAKAACDKAGTGYEVYDSKGNVVYPKATTSASTFKPYIVIVNTDVLNVRAGAGTNYKITTQVKKGEAYTTVAKSGDWGKLKSGAGWIHLGYTKKK